MKFEVSVKQFHHTPLRVTVDSCVATVVPNIDTVPRYAFLGNKGSVCWTGGGLKSPSIYLDGQTYVPTFKSLPLLHLITSLRGGCACIF